MIDLESYRTFYYVATCGSMRKAAEAMSLTPPTVTKTIRALEEQLNCLLFIRTVQGVRLTAAGEALFSHVKSGLMHLDAGEQEINMLNSLNGGTVRVAMSESAAYYFTMPSVLGKFGERYPKVKLTIKHMPNSEVKSAVLSGDLDFAILGLFGDGEYEDFNAYKIYSSKNVAVVGKKYAALAEKPIRLEELVSYPLIFTHHGYRIRRDYTNLYRRHGLKFSPNVETPTLDLQTKAVELGLGYSFVPYLYVQNMIESGQLFILNIANQEPLIYPVCLLTAKNNPISRAAQALIDIVIDAAKNA